jgi:hypothetical protein
LIQQDSLVPYVTSDGFVDGISTTEAQIAFKGGVNAFLHMAPYDRHSINIAIRDPSNGGFGGVAKHPLSSCAKPRNMLKSFSLDLQQSGDGSIKASRATLTQFGLATANRQVGERRKP